MAELLDYVVAVATAVKWDVLLAAKMAVLMVAWSVYKTAYYQAEKLVVLKVSLSAEVLEN